LIASGEVRRGFVYDGVRHDLSDQFGATSAINERGQILSATLGNAAVIDLRNNGSLSVTPLVDPRAVWTLAWATAVNNPS
jgi:hypothetical protein